MNDRDSKIFQGLLFSSTFQEPCEDAAADCRLSTSFEGKREIIARTVGQAFHVLNDVLMLLVHDALVECKDVLLIIGCEDVVDTPVRSFLSHFDELLSIAVVQFQRAVVAWR